MTSSPRRHRRRSSMEDPLNLSDVKDELNKLHEEIVPQCMKSIDQMSHHVDEFEKDYRRAIGLRIGAAAAAGTVALATGGALFVFTAGISLLIGALAATGIGAYAFVHIKEFQTKYKTDFRQTLKTKLEEFQQKISPIIEKIEQIFNLTEEILRDPTLSENQANAIRERFSRIFEKMQPLQKLDNRGAGDQMSKILHFSENLSETVAAINSALNVLEEILESEVKESSDRPAQAPRPKQMDEQEFKKKTEKFIDDMKKEINQLKNVMNELTQMKERISRDLKTD